MAFRGLALDAFTVRPYARTGKGIFRSCWAYICPTIAEILKKVGGTVKSTAVKRQFGIICALHGMETKLPPKYVQTRWYCLSDISNKNAIFVNDAGSSNYICSQALELKKNQREITSGAFYSMGLTVPTCSEPPYTILPAVITSLPDFTKRPDIPNTSFMVFGFFLAKTKFV